MLFLSSILSTLLASSLYFHRLPSESTGINILSVCQDAQGNMWFGGADGITRYDGSRYTDFRYNADGSTGSGEDHIYRLRCDADGTIWAAHLSGLSAFDAASGSFRNYPSLEETVKDLFPLSGDRFLVIVNFRLWLFDKGTGTFTREGIPASLRDFQAHVLYSPDGSTLYIGGNGRIVSVPLTLQNPQAFPFDVGICPINCILEDGPGHFWIGTEGRGLWEFAWGKSRHHGLEYVRSLCKDEDGTLWVGTKNGLAILRDGRMDVYHHDYYDTGSITHDSVYDIFRDQQGTMWLGTFYGGACYCTSRPTLFTGMVSRPGDNFLNGQIISDIVEDADGTLWIGTNSGGLNHLLPDGRFEHIGGLGEGFSDQPDIKSIHISAATVRIYIGAAKGEITVLLPRSKRLTTLHTGLQNGSYAIEGGPDGLLYIGTPDGLFSYDEFSAALVHIPVPGNQSNVTALQRMRDGTLWVGRKFGAAALEAGTYRALDLPPVLSGIRYVEDFLEDSAGRIWISSSDGLYCYQEGGVTSYSVEDGLPDNVIHGVEEDAEGRLWVSTNKGLCRFHPDTGEKWVFTVADGLPGDRFTTYAHCRTQSGDMYFGGLSWLVRFRPEHINTSYKEVAPVISGIGVNGQWRPVAGTSVRLKAGERDLSIMFSAPDYLSGQNGHFYYTLEGESLSDTWHEAGLDRIASYHGLAHGQYSFRLHYRNSAGIESPVEARFQLDIPPFWYETLAFRILVLVLLAALFIGFVLRLLARKKAEYQSEMERVRNELLNEFSLEFVRIGANKTDTDESTVAKVFYKADEEFMRKAMQVVKKNLDNPEFSVEVLASEMNMSRSNLHLRCKALFGVSAHEFIKTVRFNEACRLLLEKKHSVAEIGYMVGFTTPSYFASAFHRFMHCTPTEYVRQNGPQA